MTDQEKSILQNQEFKLWKELHDQEVLCAKSAWRKNNYMLVSYEMFLQECSESIHYNRALAKWSVIDEVITELNVKKLSVLRAHFICVYGEKLEKYVIR